MPITGEPLHITWFQSVDDPNMWSRYRTRHTEEDFWDWRTTDEVKDDPDEQGRLAMVSGPFSIPGLILVIKDNELIPAKMHDIITKTDDFNFEYSIGILSDHMDILEKLIKKTSDSIEANEETWWDKEFCLEKYKSRLSEISDVITLLGGNNG